MSKKETCSQCISAKDLGDNSCRCMNNPNTFTFVKGDEPKHTCSKFVKIK